MRTACGTGSIGGKLYCCEIVKIKDMRDFKAAVSLTETAAFRYGKLNCQARQNSKIKRVHIVPSGRME